VCDGAFIAPSEEPEPEPEPEPVAVNGRPLTLAGDDLWQEFHEAITDAQMPYSSEDLLAMRPRLRRLDFEQRLAAIRHIRDGTAAGMYGPEADAQYIPGARRFLFERLWERGLRRRAPPSGGSAKRESVTMRAAAKLWGGKPGDYS